MSIKAAIASEFPCPIFSKLAAALLRVSSSSEVRRMWMKAAIASEVPYILIVLPRKYLNPEYI